MPFFLAFGVKSEMKKMPVLASILEGNRSFYIERAAGQEGRDKVVKYITDRQEKIEQDPDESSMLIYPEGTQTNGEFLCPFKRGAFQGMKTVIPLVMKFDASLSVKPQWDCVPFLSHAILCYCLSANTVTTWTLPPFKPN